MTVSEAINQVVAYTDNTSTSDPTNDPRRARHLVNLREAVDTIRYFREWAFTRKEAALVVPGGTGPTSAFVALPADYLRLGNYGAVYNQDHSGDEMEHVPEYAITENRANGEIHGNPLWYSIFGVSATGVPLIQLPYSVAAQNLRISYLSTTPVLDEGANNANLAVALPVEYHATVLMPKLRSLARESLGDARWKNAESQYEAGLRTMLSTCRRQQGTPQRLPSFFGDR